MKKLQHFHHKSGSDPFPVRNNKLPFLSKRVHPLMFFPQGWEFDISYSRKTKQYESPKSKLEHMPEKLPTSLFSLDIPPLKYSSFKKARNRIRQNRRQSENCASINESLAIKHQTPLDSESNLKLSKQNTIKESIVNKRAFKSIESF